MHNTLEKYSSMKKRCLTDARAAHEYVQSGVGECFHASFDRSKIFYCTKKLAQFPHEDDRFLAGACDQRLRKRKASWLRIIGQRTKVAFNEGQPCLRLRKPNFIYECSSSC